MVDKAGDTWKKVGFISAPLWWSGTDLREKPHQSQVLDLSPSSGRPELEPRRSMMAFLLQTAPHWRRSGQRELQSFLEIQKVGLF